MRFINNGKNGSGGIDTSSNNPITSNDVVIDKEGFVNGKKIVGEIIEYKIGQSSGAKTISELFDLGSQNLIYEYDFPRDILQREGSRLQFNIPYNVIVDIIGLTPDILKKGIVCLGILGTYEGEENGNVLVKLFETKEEMELDKTAKEGDWALIYNSSIDDKELFDGVYQYKNNNWNILLGSIDATDEYVYEKTYYGKNGVSVGTLGTNVSLLMDDINAEIFYKLQDAYNNSEPILINAIYKPPMNIRFIPTKENGLPLWDTSNVINMNGYFYGATNLRTIPQLNTSCVTDMGCMFCYCNLLKSIPQLDTSNVINMEDMFAFCPNLDNDSLNNILAMCTNAINIIENKTLSSLGLLQTQIEKCRTLPNYQAFLDAGWTE